MNILQVEGLVKKFPEVTAVDDISFNIEKGICFGLLGPNGAGKTTTIEIIEGLQNPTSGKVLYKGHERTRSFFSEVGIQFQNTELPQFLTVKETLLLFRNFYSKKTDIDYLIQLCCLDDILKRDNRKISGGQKQRLLIAMALCNEPELIFLDEPTTGLDPQSRRHLWEIVETIKKEGRTIILTTHYMDEAQILCDVIAIMDHGKIITMDSPEKLLGQHFNSVTIIIKDNPQIHAEGFPYPFYKIEDHIEILTEDPNVCLKELIARNIDLSGISIRSQNIEDLFLKLTGHDIRS